MESDGEISVITHAGRQGKGQPGPPPESAAEKVAG
jgi:hypothetical protein